MSGRLWPFRVLLLGLWISAPVHAGSMTTMFEEANAAFGRGDWQAATDLYAGLEEMGVNSSTLLYNRGTVEARLGNPGMAVYYFERVLRQEPGHEDAAFNLNIVRMFLARRANEQGRDAELLPSAGPWRATLDRFSPDMAAVSFLVFYVLFFAMLLLRRWTKQEMARVTVAVTAWISLVLFLFLGAITLGKRHQLLHMPEAVVISVDGQLQDVLEAPAGETVRFGLEEGTRVRVMEHRRDWVKVQDDEGRNGWVTDDAVRVF